LLGRSEPARELLREQTPSQPEAWPRGPYGLARHHGIEPAVDLGNFVHPDLALGVFHLFDLRQRPVEVIGQVGYLLLQALEGVA
jgi:hypothetical protein